MRDSIKVVSELYQVFLTSLLLLVITHNLIKRKLPLQPRSLQTRLQKYMTVPIFQGKEIKIEKIY